MHTRKKVKRMDYLKEKNAVSDPNHANVGSSRKLMKLYEYYLGQGHFLTLVHDHHTVHVFRRLSLRTE